MTDAFIEKIAQGRRAVDAEKLLADRQDPEVDQQIAEAQQEAQKAGVNSTPTFLIQKGNGAPQKVVASPRSTRTSSRESDSARRSPAAPLPTRASGAPAAQRRLARWIAGIALLGVGVAAYLVTSTTPASSRSARPATAAARRCRPPSTRSSPAIPVALLGLIGYLAILGSLFVRGDLGRLAGAAIALSGFGFSMYLTYRELFTIEAICQWCVASAVLMTLLAILTVVQALEGRAGPGLAQAGTSSARSSATRPLSSPIPMRSSTSSASAR